MRISFYSAAVISAMLLAGCASPKTTAPEPVFQPVGEPSHPTIAAKPETAPQPEKPAPTVQPTAPTNLPAPAKAVATKPATPETTSTITIVEGLKGKIASANTDLKFVVITFPIGQMARVDQHLNVYRDGNKVGELTVTGPPLDDSIVADISAGEAKVGDEVRDK